MIAALKAIHIAAMLCWCAGLVALPLLIIGYAHARSQARYSEFRLLTHYGYVCFATPAAVVTVAAGIGLIFSVGVFDLWFVAKLAFVSAMALVHAFIGHMIVLSGEERRGDQAHARGAPGFGMAWPALALAIGLPAMAMVLVLVLGKPDLWVVRDYLPAFMLEPRGAP